MIKLLKIAYAEVVELADASDSKSDGSDTVWVQVPPSAPKKGTSICLFLFLLLRTLVNYFKLYHIFKNEFIGNERDKLAIRWFFRT